MGIKALLILNGAAAISLLTLIGHMVRVNHVEEAASLASALLYFGWGAFFGPTVAFLSYITQLFYSQSIWDNDDEEAKKLSNSNKAQHIHILAFLFTIASLACFLFGLYESVNAFKSMGN